MAETIDELTVSYREGDLETVQELDKVVLSKGAWTTISSATGTGTGPRRFTGRRNTASVAIRNATASINNSPSSTSPAAPRPRP